MPTMNVNLTPEMADYVSSELASGDYASASELVREALRSLRRDRDLEAQKFALLKQELEIGIGEAERGEFSSRTVDDILTSVRRAARG